MKPEQKIETQLQELADAIQTRQTFADEVMEKIQEIPPASSTPADEKTGRPTHSTRLNPFLKFAVAAAVILVVWGGITLWPTQKEWWLQPAMAKTEILQKLENVKALVYRQLLFSESDFGVVEHCGADEIRYCGPDVYRRDRYRDLFRNDDGQILNTQWIIREPDGIYKTEVDYELQCYFVEEDVKADWSFYENQIRSLKWHVNLLDKADRILEMKEFEGRQCVGFQIDKSRYGDNPPGSYDVIWFDTKTRLPVRTEDHGMQTSFTGRKVLIIHDQFEFYEEVPANLFITIIPDGFVNKHPDQVHREAKGNLVYAGVPQETEDQILRAVQQAQTVRYRWTLGTLSRIYSVSKKVWRVDEYDGDRHYKTTWYTVQQSQDTSPDADPTEKVWKTIQQPGNPNSESFYTENAPWHPLEALLFHLNFVDQADRILPEQEVEGKWCFGLEISAKKWGDNSDDMIERWWFDIETFLPVHMEFECDANPDLMIRNQFEWAVDLSQDLIPPAAK